MTNKFQDELRAAIYDACSTCKWEKLESLISRSVDIKALELAIAHFIQCDYEEGIQDKPEYWIKKAGEQ